MGSHDGITPVPGTPHERSLKADLERFTQQYETRTGISNVPVEEESALAKTVRLMGDRKLPVDASMRKALPVATGVLDYFPDALVAVAEVSRVGNDQHNPGQPLHWDKTKSTDHADSLVRHLLERPGFDADGIRHSAKVAWRALALLQTEIEDASYNA
jgi:hypothetical protein